MHRFALLAITLAAAALQAQTAVPQTAAAMLVDVDWLSAHLNDRNLVILHIGPKDGYETGHIPGARLITLDDIARPRDPKELTLELPSAENLRAKLASFGIGDDSRVVLYFGVKQAFQSATRVIFTLDYLGLASHTSLLNGGLPAWTSAGKQISTALPSAAVPARLAAGPTKDLVVDAAYVQAIKQHSADKLIDARTPAFYKGTDPTFDKNGHIPGAVNITYSDLLDDKLLLDRDRAEKLFTAAGVKPGDTVVAYCHIGQQATAVIFAARLLGHPVKLYDGSFEDWAKNGRGPVEK